MAVVSVRATVVEDNTGIKSEMPILLTEQGELGAVTDYLLKMEADGNSISMMKLRDPLIFRDSNNSKCAGI